MTGSISLQYGAETEGEIQRNNSPDLLGLCGMNGQQSARGQMLLTGEFQLEGDGRRSLAGKVMPKQ